jgi:hypothetical protein
LFLLPFLFLFFVVPLPEKNGRWRRHENDEKVNDAKVDGTGKRPKHTKDWKNRDE